MGTARWRKRRRESSASLFILVQIQAGPPAFARRASKRQAAGEAVLPEAWKMPVDGAFQTLSRLRNLV
jgi:hypothetical protein